MDRLDLVLKFVATQDAKQWEPAKLLEWATTMAKLYGPAEELWKHAEVIKACGPKRDITYEFVNKDNFLD